MMFYGIGFVDDRHTAQISRGITGGCMAKQGVAAMLFEGGDWRAMLPHYLLDAERGLERVHVTGPGVDTDFDSIFGIWSHCMEIPYFST